MPRRLSVACLGFYLLTMSVGCSDAGADGPRITESSRGATTRSVRRGSFEERVFLTGILEATRGVRLTPPRTPTWQVQIRWMEEDGAGVAAGDKVVEFDNSAFATDLEQTYLAAQKAEKELQRQRAQADARGAELGFAVSERRVDLEKAELEADVPKELIPLREYQEKQLAMERARTALAKAEEELATHARTSEQELAIQQINLEKTRYDIRIAEKAISELVLEAPRDGVLIVGDVRREGRKLQVGDTVWPGYIVGRIPDLGEMQVEAQLSDVDDGRVRVGFDAQVRLDSYPEAVFSGVVRDITPVAQETSPRSLRRAFRVRIALEHTDRERMRPGMAARVEIRVPGLADVLLVPRDALDFSSASPGAWLVSGERVDVTLGPCNSFECVLESGLEDGDELRVRAGP